jgi:uncharacterized protein YndB with AHSA1/START domain
VAEERIPKTNAASAARHDTKQELCITRFFDAPPEMVFRAWTDPRQVAEWWGPDGFTNPVCEWDARCGGAIRLQMLGPDGSEFPIKGQFHEVAEPERLVLKTSAFEGRKGPQVEVLHMATFIEHGSSTELRLRALAVARQPESASALDGMGECLKESMDRLTAHLGLISSANSDFSNLLR